MIYTFVIMELPAHQSSSWNPIKRSHFSSLCAALEGTSTECERGDSPSSIIYRKPSCICDFSDRLRKPSRAEQSAVIPLPNYYFLFLLSPYKQCFIHSILPGSFPTPSSVYVFLSSSIYFVFLSLFLSQSYSFSFSFLFAFVSLGSRVHFPYLTSFYSLIPSVTYPLIPSPLAPLVIFIPKKEKKGEEGGMKQEERDIGG